MKHHATPCYQHDGLPSGVPTMQYAFGDKSDALLVALTFILINHAAEM